MNTVKNTQTKTFDYLISQGKNTEYGRKHNFSAIKDLNDYKNNVPVNTYEDFQPYIDRMKMGEKHILWPGAITDYAVSAGTSGKGKHIPLSKERFKSDQKFMRRVVLKYLSQTNNVFSVLGSHVSLPGNIDTLDSNPDVNIGEISAYLAKKSPAWLSLFQIRSPEKMIKEQWAEKFERCLEKAIECDVRQITAVPSWALRFFQRALEKTGKYSIQEVWPNLKVLICGGEDIKTYLPHFEYLCRGLNMDYVENYGASEGYFAFSDDLNHSDLRLTIDNGLFYEWVPYPKNNPRDIVLQNTIPTWEVEAGIPYAMIVTNNSGLWRYCINDIIEFTNPQSTRIKVLGRTSEMLDRFGEALQGHQAEEVLCKTVKQVGAEFSSFIMGGLLEDNQSSPHHLWFIQWVKKPDNLEQFIALLDNNLRESNRRYAIRREGETIAGLKVYELDQDILHRWKYENMQAGAQTKVPRIILDDDKLIALKRLCDSNSDTVMIDG
ncbi:MAG: GH3 auxin-responsive promoter family protein [Balneolales bacterium]